MAGKRSRGLARDRLSALAQRRAQSHRSRTHQPSRHPMQNLNPQQAAQGQIVAFPVQVQGAINQHVNELAQVELRLSEINDERRKLSARKHELRGIVATLRTLTPVPDAVVQVSQSPVPQPEAPASTQ